MRKQIVLLTIFFGLSTVSSVLAWEGPFKKRRQERRLVLQGKDVPFASDTGTQPEECKVQRTDILTNGVQAVWASNSQIIFYVNTVKGNYEIFRMNADGSNKTCLTCGENLPAELKGKHKGVPSAGADGRYVVFMAENEYGSHRFTNTPGFGFDNDFWAMDLEGHHFWRLTKFPEGSAIQFPRFSIDGEKFAWSNPIIKGQVFKKGGEYGKWWLKMADFIETPDGPKFDNIIKIKPAGEGYYEPHGFSPDNQKVIFTAMVDPRKSQYYGEIFTYDLVTRELNKLVADDNLHFEQAVYTPGGHKISLMSGPFIGLLNFAYKTDLYLMDDDGKNRVRLTYFNEPGHPEYTGSPTLMNKHDWSVDGTKLIGSYYIHEKEREQKVFVLTFQGACGRL